MTSDPRYGPAPAPLRPIQRRARRIRAGRIAAALGLLLALLPAGALPAAAQTTVPLDLSSFTHQDLRALSMGNAYVGVARGENAMVYNPAGVVQFPWDVKVEYSYTVSANSGLLSDLYKLQSGDDTQALQDFLNSVIGTDKRYSTRGYASAVVDLKFVGFGIGKLDTKTSGYTFDDVDSSGTADPTDTVTLDKDQLKMSLTTFGFQLFDQQMLLGGTLKHFTFDRATSGAVQILNLTNLDLATTATSYDANSFDVGFLWRLETLFFIPVSSLRMQWGVTAYDVGGVTLEKAGADTLQVPATYGVGLSAAPELPWSPVHLLLSLELEDFTSAVKVRDSMGTDHERSLSQRVHAGVELGFWRSRMGNHLISVRAGSNRGQLTYGLEANVTGPLFFIPTWPFGLNLVYTHYRDDAGYVGNPDPREFDAAQLEIYLEF